MLLAEELEVAPEQVRLEHAPPDDKRYGNPFFGDQMTGASSSVRAFYDPLRRAGATARAMLVAAPAASWNVDPASCQAPSKVNVTRLLASVSAASPPRVCVLSVGRAREGGQSGRFAGPTGPSGVAPAARP